jgi:RNA polymerase sigma-70 factor (sigma-E family)
MRFARLVTADAGAAQDIVQDALVAVLLRWKRLSADGGQDAYARRVVVNRRISWWRQVGRREQLVPAPELPPRPAGSAEEPEVDADQARRLLAALPQRQRAAVVLRFYEDLTFAEIGDLLGCPESTARSHVHRALQRLRTVLSPEDGHDRSR